LSILKERVERNLHVAEDHWEKHLCHDLDEELNAMSGETELFYAHSSNRSPRAFGTFVKRAAVAPASPNVY
jgi:hypothetical protein